MAYWKKIKNTNAVPVLKDDLVFDQTPTVNSTNPVTSDGVARAIAGASGEVPVVTENDNGKVLKAIYDAGGPAVEWGEATVDQTYDATSTNAQSGVAVAQAISAIPSVSYTAGDGIEIDAQNAVSVKAGNGLSINNSTSVDMTLKAIKRDDRYYSIGQLTAQAVAAIKGNASLAVTVLGDSTINPSIYSFIDVRIAILPGIDAGRLPDVAAAKAILSTTNIRSSFEAGSGTSLYTMPANTQVTVDFSSPTIGSNISWADVEANPTNYLLVIVGNYYGMLYGPAYSEAAGSDPEQKDVATIGYTVPGDNSLQVSNPVPTYAVGDANKVLTVNAGGTGVEWAAAPQELPTIAGNANKILAVNSGATGTEWIAQPEAPEYVGGQGIEISNLNAVSARVGNGIAIGTASSTESVSETSKIAATRQVVYDLNANAVSALDSGSITVVTLVDYTLPYNESFFEASPKYRPGIAELTSGGDPIYNKLMVFGSTALDGTSVSSTTYKVPANTTVVFNRSDVYMSQIQWSDVVANPTNYALIFIAYTANDASSIAYTSSSIPAGQTLDAATVSYTYTETVPNCIVMEHPIEVVSSLPASPTSGVLYIVTGA